MLALRLGGGDETLRSLNGLPSFVWRRRVLNARSTA